MGVVLRARDTKLLRDVALKVLPDHFADDPDRLSRFQREAQILASVNHPNIAQIYGLEQVGNSGCIVMELVDGETLAERLKNGPIPVGHRNRAADCPCIVRRARAGYRSPRSEAGKEVTATERV